MVRIAFAIIFFISIQFAFSAYGARQVRPFTGIGLLIIRPAATEDTDANNSIPIYEERGIRRIAELKAMELPGLIPSVSQPPGEYATVVTDKKGEWLKIAYDDADREGWIAKKRSWQYIPWRDFLKGRHVLLLPKLRAADYKLYAECSDSSEPLADVSRLSDFQIVEVVGDWVKVRTALAATGFIRWRGADGRFLISPGESGP